MKKTIDAGASASRMSSIKDLKFLTPVRRSCRIGRNSCHLPTMLQEHDPCVSSLAELLKLDDSPNAFIYRKNPALMEHLADLPELGSVHVEWWNVSGYSVWLPKTFKYRDNQLCWVYIDRTLNVCIKAFHDLGSLKIKALKTGVYLPGFSTTAWNEVYIKNIDVDINREHEHLFWPQSCLFPPQWKNPGAKRKSLNGLYKLWSRMKNCLKMHKQNPRYNFYSTQRKV